MLRLASTLSILALFLVGAAADAKCTGTGYATSRTQTTQTVTFQSVQVVQPPVVAVQAGGCQGSVGTVAHAGGCAGSQGVSGRQHKLFSGSLLHHGSGNGLLARHKKQGASSGYEQTTTVRQWDNRPTAIVVIPPAEQKQQQP